MQISGDKMFQADAKASTKARGQEYARHVGEPRAKELAWLGGGEVTAEQAGPLG